MAAKEKNHYQDLEQSPGTPPSPANHHLPIATSKNAMMANATRAFRTADLNEPDIDFSHWFGHYGRKGGNYHKVRKVDKPTPSATVTGDFVQQKYYRKYTHYE